MAAAAANAGYLLRPARELRTLKRRAGLNGKPSSRREQPNRQYFFKQRRRRNRRSRSTASDYALTSSARCLTLRARFASGKAISFPLPDPAAVCIVISGIRRFVTAVGAHFVRCSFRVPGRRRLFCNASSATMAASRARFSRFKSIRIVSSLKSPPRGSAQHS